MKTLGQMKAYLHQPEEQYLMLSQFYFSVGSEKMFPFVKKGETVARFPIFFKNNFHRVSAVQHLLYFSLVKLIFAPTLSKNTSLHFTLFVFKSELVECRL